MRGWKKAVAAGVLISAAWSLPAKAQSGSPSQPTSQSRDVGHPNSTPTHDDKAVVNGAPGAHALIRATPAIWRVKGAHGTLYLFGTIHIMKPNVEWETGKVKDAFTASDTVYVEVANLDDQAAALPLAAQFGMDMAHPLSTKITKEDVALLDTAAKSMGLPGEAMLEPMQPWLVTMSMSVLPMMKAGYDPASGVDVVLLGEARKAGKKISGFETMEQQLHFVADQPQAEQVARLHEELAGMDKSAAEMSEMMAAWERGDVAKIAALETGELKTKHPEEYKTLVVDRNTKWAATLDDLLKDAGTGTVFVAVGAAHLAGDDSLIELLKKDGWVVARE